MVCNMFGGTSINNALQEDLRTALPRSTCEQADYRKQQPQYQNSSSYSRLKTYFREKHWHVRIPIHQLFGENVGTLLHVRMLQDNASGISCTRSIFTGFILYFTGFILYCVMRDTPSSRSIAIFCTMDDQ